MKKNHKSSLIVLSFLSLLLYNFGLKNTYAKTLDINYFNGAVCI